MFQTKTDYKLCNDVPKQNCTVCRAKESVSRIEARTRKNILIAKIEIASEYFWKCEACGWASSPTTAGTTKSRPTANTSTNPVPSNSTSTPNDNITMHYNPYNPSRIMRDVNKQW
ncbi:hypothetical protein LENED_000080 [Lentinula edodes]|uniref:Uncharacterized protein n=1 Tax=Lentinula edodes TaxID=5353 RepID=A0A1Q3DUM7_LENED|nr:hypothetical protein LENED_000080 [Lentinula edodes]